MNRSRTFWMLLILTPAGIVAGLARSSPRLRFYRQADIEAGAYRSSCEGLLPNFSGILERAAIDPARQDGTPL
ncbi:MAG: hypothetical protein U0744_19625 [Gemmataceae bacterium]